MENNKQNNFTIFLNILAKIVAVIMIVRYALLIVHTYYPFLQNRTILDILNYIDLYAPLVLMVVVSLSVVWNKSDILKLVMIVVCTAIIIFCCFPAVRQTIEQFTGIAQNTH